MVQANNGLLTDSWQLIHDTISGGIPDPESRGKKWIFADHPDANGNSFPGYPIITVQGARIDILKAGFITLKDYDVNFELDVWSEKNVQADGLIGSLIQLFNSNESNLAASGLGFDDALPSDSRTVVFGKNKVRNRKIVYQFSLTSV